jgi:hypothetical protein
MGLFLHEVTPISAPPRPRVSRLAIWALIIAATGFLNVVGFIVGPALGIAALMRLRLTRDAGVDLRGRRLAFAAIWLSVGAVAVGLAAICAMLLVAYAQLPAPPAPHFHL